MFPSWQKVAAPAAPRAYSSPGQGSGSRIGTERMILSARIFRFGAYCERGLAWRDRAPFVLCQSGCRWQAGASRVWSAHDL